MSDVFYKVAIIGMGLMGSSIARALKHYAPNCSITACDHNELSLLYARKYNFADSVSPEPALAVRGADVVILAVPLGALEECAQAIAPNLKPSALVMDVGSVKQYPLEILSRTLPSETLLVPAHPIAGSEQSGISAGSADLLNKKRVIITPDAPLTHAELQRVNLFWETLGAHVEAMPASMHDRIYGYVSHLPQLLVFAAAPVIAASPGEINAQPALQKFLRLAASNQLLWRDIAWLNREVIVSALHRYLDVIGHISRELSQASEPASEEPDTLARTVLLPRILASCLITTVMEAEKNAGIRFARFAGSGFADVTAPATIDPEADLALISAHYAQTRELLDRLCLRLQAITQALESADQDLLLHCLK